MAWVKFEKPCGVNGALVSVLYFLWEKIIAWFRSNSRFDSCLVVYFFVCVPENTHSILKMLCKVVSSCKIMATIEVMVYVLKVLDFSAFPLPLGLLQSSPTKPASSKSLSKRKL